MKHGIMDILVVIVKSVATLGTVVIVLGVAMIVMLGKTPTLSSIVKWDRCTNIMMTHAVEVV